MLLRRLTLGAVRAAPLVDELFRRHSRQLAGIRGGKNGPFPSAFLQVMQKRNWQLQVKMRVARVSYLKNNFVFLGDAPANSAVYLTLPIIKLPKRCPAVRRQVP